MKQKRMVSLLLVLTLMAALLAGCACKHEWKDANCKEPKTCTLCGETEGEKTTEHKWEDATTEAPKTCTVCGATEGEKINTDSRFKTAACKDLFGTWTGNMKMTAAEMGLVGDSITEIQITYTFSNDGKMTGSMKMEDISGYAKLMEDMLYAQFEAQGMSKQQAETAMQQTYGMGVAAYAEKAAKQVADTFAATKVDMVYYVEDGKIYNGLNWEAEMTGNEFSIENGVLHMIDDGKNLELTKAEE